MTILEKLDSDIKEAMKARHLDRLAAVRLIKATVKNKEIELIHPLSEPEFFATLATMAKQRQESIEQFKKGNRNDLAAIEEKELEIINSYLPKSLSEAEVESMINDAITKVGAKTPKEMGLVMKELKEKTAGRVDGKLLSDKVRAKLSSL